MMNKGLLVSLAVVLAVSVSCKERGRSGGKASTGIDAIAQAVTAPGWIKFKPEAKVNPKTLFADHADIFHLPAGNEMVAQPEEKDELGVTHLRFQQLFKGVAVEHAEFRVRAKDGIAVSANGRLAYDFQPATTAPQIPEERAWEIVRQHLPAERYFREDNLAADLTSEGTADQAAPYRPKGQLLFTEDPKATGGERKLAWMFKVYVTPSDRSRQIYIDALDGSIMKERPLFPNCQTGSAPITFRGTLPINTDQKTDGRFYLNDNCDGNVLSSQLLDSSSKVVPISDEDNNWVGNNPSIVTSLWGLRASYDYYRLVHGRNSWDGKNGNMTIFGDPTMSNNGRNANGGGGVIHTGLNGPGDNDDYNTLDIIGHEFTHSVIEKTAGLVNDTAPESGALNESFCDIFGQMIEQWIEGGTSKEWVIGDDKGCASPDICRDLWNPKTYKGPDTYNGLNFQNPCNDQHINGEVQNRWFALLCDGGSGTNVELGTPYSVGGIGLTKGRNLAYRTLTRYLVSGSDYVDAREGSISAAEDLYGVNSSEVGDVTKAWCAVGLCPYGLPKQPDKFDQPGGNPNPASPDNNNSASGATPIGTGVFSPMRIIRPNEYLWSSARFPVLTVSDLSIFPINDVDNFNVSFPPVQAPGGRCFSSGLAFSTGTPVNARIFFNGVLAQSFVNTASFGVPLNTTGGGSFLLEISAAFPGQVLDYDLQISFFLHFNSSCYETTPPDLWQQIQECPMCNLKLLNPIDRVILEPFYRNAEKVPIEDHFFQWNGEGSLDVSMNVLQGNGLHVDLVNAKGQVVTTSESRSTGGVQLHLPNAARGVYSLRFSGFGNGTEVVVRTSHQ